MTRRLLNLLTALSLLLCAAVAAMSVRSHWVSEDVYSHGLRFYQRHGPAGYSFNIQSAAGGVGLHVSCPDGTLTRQELERLRDNFMSHGWEVSRYPPAYPRLRSAPAPIGPGSIGRPAPPDPPQPLSWRLLGVDGKVEPAITDFATYTVYRVVFPYWMLAALLSLLPAVRLRSILRRRRARGRSALGLCPSCGYNLTGNVSGVCPECGQASTRPVECSFLTRRATQAV